MSKLRSAEEFEKSMYGLSVRQKCDAFKARDAEVAQVCAGDASRKCLEVTGYRLDGRIYRAILHAIDPPEDPRERLGRTLYEADRMPVTPWSELHPSTRAVLCNRAAVVAVEKAKIDKEASGE